MEGSIAEDSLREKTLNGAVGSLFHGFIVHEN